LRWRCLFGWRSRSSRWTPEQARVPLEQLGHDLQDAVQELRTLAHGIHPLALRDRGLVAALESAVGRAALRVVVVGSVVGRFFLEVLAAVLLLPGGVPERGQARRRGGRR
jgi:signal transduction histidine kinase